MKRIAAIAAAVVALSSCGSEPVIQKCQPVGDGSFVLLTRVHGGYSAVVVSECPRGVPEARPS